MSEPESARPHQTPASTGGGQREAILGYLATFDGVGDPRGYLADDVVAMHWRWKQELHGKEAVIQLYWRVLRDAFPDLRFRVLQSYIGEDFVVVRGEFNGTFMAAWAGLEPHGRWCVWRAHDIYEFRDGKIVRIWLANDTLNVARQLGALPDDGKPW